MKIVHRISFSGQETLEGDLIRYGISYKKLPIPSGSFLIVFDIAESHSHWSDISSKAKSVNASDIAKTVFTLKEILEAKYARVTPDYLWTYPKPEDGWKSHVYDDWCQICGVGQQTRNFWVDREPKPNKNTFMSLFWAYPVLCVSAVMDTLGARGISGYERWPVMVHSTGSSSRYIEQIFVTQVSKSPTVEAAGLQVTHCSKCGTNKFARVNLGMITVHKDALIPNIDIQQTHEYFGEGLEAFREIIISNRLAQMITDHNWKGLKIEPVKVI